MGIAFIVALLALTPEQEVETWKPSIAEREINERAAKEGALRITPIVGPVVAVVGVVGAVAAGAAVNAAMARSPSPAAAWSGSSHSRPCSRSDSVSFLLRLVRYSR